ncbi:ABC transporter permease [Mycoplasmopsis adleri]|uniref:ABC transporter permease n=1 Tax=Mycoplasmopsis adleri TaxID=51362 RepID=UPI003873B8D3
MCKNLNALFVRIVKLFFTDARKIIMTFFSPVLTFIIFVVFGKYLFSTSVRGLSDIDALKYADAWLLFGLMSMTVLTNAVSLSVFMVQDSEKKIFNDFTMTPIKTSTIRLSYLFFNCLLNVLISLLVFTLLIIYMAIRQTLSVLSGPKSIYVLLVVILGALANSIFFTFVFSYIKNVTAYSAITAALSSVAGFLIGAFIPLTILPIWLQGFSTILPATQVTSLMKWIVLHDLSPFNVGVYADQYKITWATLDMPWWGSLIYTAGFALLSLTLSVALTYNSKKAR